MIHASPVMSGRAIPAARGATRTVRSWPECFSTAR